MYSQGFLLFSKHNTYNVIKYKQHVLTKKILKYREWKYFGKFSKEC